MATPHGVTLNSVDYPIKGEVHRSPRIQWGDSLRLTAEQLPTDKMVPSWIQADWSGGVGIQKMLWLKESHRIKFEDSTCETRYEGQVTPAILANTPTGPEEVTAADTVALGPMTDFLGSFYSLARYRDGNNNFDDATVFVFDPDHATTQWDKKAEVLAGTNNTDRVSPGDLKRHGVYLFASFFYTTAAPTYAHKAYRSSDAATWDAKVTGLPAGAVSDMTNLFLSFGVTLLLTLWDNSASTILIYKSTDNGDAWALACTIPSAGAATGLCEWVDPDGVSVPIVGTQEGPCEIPSLAVDSFVRILPMPTDSHNCKDMCVHNGQLIVPKGKNGGCQVCFYSNGALGSMEIGINKDDGLVTEAQGGITALITTNEGQLMAAVGGEAATT